MIEVIKVDLSVGDITYQQNKNTGEAILFIHGNSCSADAFQKQISSEKFKGYRLISIDLPGHGRSSHAMSPETTYSLLGLAKVIQEFLTALSLTRVILVGHSLGGNIALETAAIDDRVKAIMMIGALPAPHDPSSLGRMFNPCPIVPLLFQGVLREDEMAIFAAEAYNGGEIPSFAASDAGCNHTIFRPSLGASIGAGIFSDEADFVANSPLPLALVFGKHDGICNLDFLDEISFANLWKSEAQILSGGHSPFWTSPIEFNDTLEEFLAYSTPEPK